MFDSPEKLALGFLTGILFGFLLQKGRVAKFEVIVGQFLFRDWTVVKTMGTAVAVGSIGVYALVAADMASLHIRPALFGGVLVGAVCFGIGMAVLGYCPGTSVAACGEGRRDAMSGVAGMFCGALLFVLFYPALQGVIHGFGNLGKVTLPELTDTPIWLWLAALAAGGVALYLLAPRSPSPHIPPPRIASTASNPPSAL
ncbi:MAG: YeeE/YedE thiosulfate transporter family protein [Pirellulaceae bacterium]